jgi:hypothetical protein
LSKENLLHQVLAQIIVSHFVALLQEFSGVCKEEETVCRTSKMVGVPIYWTYNTEMPH